MEKNDTKLQSAPINVTPRFAVKLICSGGLGLKPLQPDFDTSVQFVKSMPEPLTN